jgi:hypothetical protein
MTAQAWITLGMMIDTIALSASEKMRMGLVTLISRMTLRAPHRHTFVLSAIAPLMSETFFPANSLGQRPIQCATSAAVSTIGGRA